MGLATDVDINIRILTELVYRISPSLSLSTAVPVFCYTSAEIVIFCRCVYLSLTNCLSADNPKVVDDFWWMFLKEWDTGLAINHQILVLIRNHDTNTAIFNKEFYYLVYCALRAIPNCT